MLEVNNRGSGFTVHELLVAWDENSTWLGLGNGVQADDSEAAATPIATFGVNNSNENVPGGPLMIDVTATVQSYLDGQSTNLGWVTVTVC